MDIRKWWRMSPRERDDDTDDLDVPQFDRRRGGGDAITWRLGAVERALKTKADDKDLCFLIISERIVKWRQQLGML
jgi:hypothetical protein